MDVVGVVAILLIIGITLFVSGRLAKQPHIPFVVSRKLLHVIAIGAVAITPVFFTNYWLLAVIMLLSAVMLGVAVFNRWLAVDGHNRRSWGIALFVVGFLLLWLVFGKQQPWLVIYPMLVLAFADAAAALVGERFATHFFLLSTDRKSIPGSVAFGLITLVVLGVFPLFLGSLHPTLQLPAASDLPIEHWLVICVIIAAFCTAVEASTSGGWDNVTVPLAAAWMLIVLPSFPMTAISLSFFAMMVMCVLAWFAILKEWLDAGGAVMAAIIGFIVWLAGEWILLAPLLFFFLSGSLLSRLKPREGVVSDKKHRKPRDYMQVLSNGGVAAACLIWATITGEMFGIILFFVSVAISTADTWSSELGMWAGGAVVDIVDAKPLPSGISGGVSWQGTLAGLAGAGFIALLAHASGITGAIWVGLGGFAGMLADSVMGSLLQARYRVTEAGNGREETMVEYLENNQPGHLEKGIKWVTNDWVNLLSNLIITVLLGVLLLLLAK